MGDVGNLKILPEIPEIRAEAKRLKSEGVNILIALGHSGINIDLEIAAQVEDIDLVVGGHTNTFLYTGKCHFCALLQFFFFWFIPNIKSITLCEIV